MAKTYDEFINALKTGKNPSKKKYTDEEINSPQIQDKIQEAIRKGKIIPPEYAKEGPPEPEKTQLERSPQFVQRAASFYTEDVPEIYRGVSERAEERAARIARPTVQGNIAAQAMEKTGAPRLLSDIVEQGASFPERAVRGAGLVGGTAADFITALGQTAIRAAKKTPVIAEAVDVLGPLFGGAGKNLAKATNWILGGVPKRLLDVYGPELKHAMGSLYNTWSNMPQEDKDNWGAFLDSLAIYPIAKTLQLSRKAGSGVGKALEKTGKKLLTKQLKPREELLRKVPGSNRLEQGRKLAGDIIDVQTARLPKSAAQSATGFEKMANRANYIANKAWKKADDIFMKNHADQEIDLSKAFQEAQNYAYSLQPGGPKERAIKIYNKILDGYSKEGFAGVKKVKDAIKLKKRLQEGMEIYKKGPNITPTEAIDIQIRKTISNALIRQLDEVNPRAGFLNRMARDMFNVKDAAMNAAYNIEKAPIKTDILHLTSPLTYTSPITAQGRGPVAISQLGRRIQGGSGLPGTIAVGLEAPLAQAGAKYSASPPPGARNIGGVPTVIRTPEEEERQSIPLYQLGR